MKNYPKLFDSTPSQIPVFWMIMRVTRPRSINLMTRLRVQSFGVRLNDEPRVGTPLPRYLMPSKFTPLLFVQQALTSSSSSFTDYERSEPIMCHSLLPNKARNNFQLMLHHQPWRESYSLDFNTEDGFSTAELSTISQQIFLLGDDLRNFLTSKTVSSAQRCLLAAQISGLVWEAEVRGHS